MTSRPLPKSTHRHDHGAGDGPVRGADLHQPGVVDVVRQVLDVDVGEALLAAVAAALDALQEGADVDDLVGELHAVDLGFRGVGMGRWVGQRCFGRVELSAL
jgi:hypothetical protein